jgi:hypothetical protein
LSITLRMRGLPLALLAFALAGCAVGGGGGAPEDAADDGYTRYQISSGNFSVEVPDTWHATTSTQMHKASFKLLARENPVFRPYAAAAAKKNSPFKFFAYDPVVRERFATNLNVIVSPAGRQMSAEKFRRGAVAEAKALAASKVRATDVTLPAGAALRLDYRARFSLAGKRKTVATLQYALLIGRKAYVLTYTTLPAFRSEYDWAFRRSANSFRLSELPAS